MGRGSSHAGGGKQTITAGKTYKFGRGNTIRFTRQNTGKYNVTAQTRQGKRVYRGYTKAQATAIVNGVVNR